MLTPSRSSFMFPSDMLGVRPVALPRDSPWPMALLQDCRWHASNSNKTASRYVPGLALTIVRGTSVSFSHEIVRVDAWLVHHLESSCSSRDMKLEPLRVISSRGTIRMDDAAAQPVPNKR